MKNKRSVLAIIFLLLFVCNYAWNGLFFHLHYINGIVVVHSHPFSTSGHTHNSEEYNYIFHLNNLLYLNNDTEYFLDKVYLVVINSEISNLSFSINSFNFGVSDLRAPPSFF